jgi:hypothetical protein
VVLVVLATAVEIIISFLIIIRKKSTRNKNTYKWSIG